MVTYLSQDGFVSFQACQATLSYIICLCVWTRLQFMSAGMSQCAVPASIHCDHLIQAVEGAELDLKVAELSCRRYNLIFPIALHCHKPRSF